MDLDDLVKSKAAVVTVAEVAELLGVDVRTVTRAMNNGDLPALRVGRRLLVPRLPLLAHLGVPDTGPAAAAGALAC
ncbi:helix-turn-helix domain-containing protein [Geodermatophilaceae bacterium NBWT11]|nr:helix-turn-helix domain-containing protein [Geodermatophilaceae bacterium NBWT11]